jgi:SPP1 family predicted phage head-tail adaptor
VLSRRGQSAPGRLKKRLGLETATPAPDGAGGSTLSWSLVATVWGEVVPLKAEEKAIGEGLADVVTHRVVVRHRSDVAAGDRFTLGARVLRIKGVSDPDADGRYLVCLCEEEGAA